MDPTTNTQLQIRRMKNKPGHYKYCYKYYSYIENTLQSDRNAQRWAKRKKDAHTESLIATIKGRPEWRRIMDLLWSLRAALLKVKLQDVQFKGHLSYICEVGLDQKLTEVFCNAMPLA